MTTETELSGRSVLLPTCHHNLMAFSSFSYTYIFLGVTTANHPHLSLPVLCISVTPTICMPSLTTSMNLLFAHVDLGTFHLSHPKPYK